MNAADGATVAAAVVAGLLTGRAASRHAARLLAGPQPAGPQPAGPRPAAPRNPPARGPPAPQPAGRRTSWVLVLGTGLAFAIMALRFGPGPPLPAFCYLAGIGIPLAMIDIRCRRLPDALILPSYPVALAFLGLAALLLPGGGRHFLSALAGMAVAWALFLLQVLIYPAGLGGGDVKLSGLLGLYLGWLGLGPAGRRAVPRVRIRRCHRPGPHRREAGHAKVAPRVRPVPAGRHARCRAAQRSSRTARGLRGSAAGLLPKACNPGRGPLPLRVPGPGDGGADRGIQRVDAHGRHAGIIGLEHLYLDGPGFRALGQPGDLLLQ